MSDRTKMVMITLIGEQPIPNLLPLRHCRPSKAVFLCTDRTQRVAGRLKRLVEEKDQITADIILTSPYDMRKIKEDLEEFTQHQGWTSSELIFNLTGGTKIMMLAAYSIARRMCAPFIYLQSEGNQSIVRRYEFCDGDDVEVASEEVSGVITIEDYLLAHVDDLPSRNNPPPPGKKKLGELFEGAIEEAIRGVVDELESRLCWPSKLELDLVVRIGNQVGIVQAKTGKAAQGRDGLDELQILAREYLGTYTKKILVINQRWDERSPMRDLAKAWQITLIELPSFTESHPSLSEEDRERLQSEVRRALAGE